MKKYKISFSGKEYPEYRPSAMTLLAENKEGAEKEVGKFLKAWKIKKDDIKIKIKEVE